MSVPAILAVLAVATVNHDVHGDPFVTIGATVRLERAFSSRAEQRRYSVVAAPRLQAGQRLDDELFGGSSLGRLPHRKGIWYTAEAVQLRRRASVKTGARWQVALARGNRIVGVVKTVRIRRG
jgi:hypothetical protein